MRSWAFRGVECCLSWTVGDVVVDVMRPGSGVGMARAASFPRFLTPQYSIIASLSESYIR